jgi:histidinol-phosphate aminotransferase
VRYLKLNSNESPLGPSPKALEAMRAVLADCHLYPDNEAKFLRAKVAELHQVDPDRVLVCPGLTDLLGIIARVLLKPGLNAVTSQRSFVVYPIATKSAGADLIEAPMRDDVFDLDVIAAAINHDTRLVFLANPNNPTGTLVGAHATDRFLQTVPDSVTVILDEAYSDYADYFAVQRGIEYSHSLEYVREGRNLLVLRTFSKAHGLAGARVAYALGPAELLRRFAEVQSTFAVSVPAQAGAAAALDDLDHIACAVKNNAEGANLLSQELLQLGFRVPQTWGNFIYCDLQQDAAAFAQKMKQEGVLIRPLASWGAPAAIRITIGTPDQNRKFLRTFRTVLARH